MGNSKRNASDLKQEQENEGLDDQSMVESQPTKHQPESDAQTRGDIDSQPLKDRHGSPINTRPPGMDA